MSALINAVMSVLRRATPAVVLLASIVPVAFIAMPMAKDEHDRFEDRYLERDAIEPPDVEAPQLDLPTFGAGVPVLAYHGIGEDGRFAVTREGFAEQMAMLDDAGVETIGVDEYVSFMRGDEGDLPDRPLLLTFDDGKLSSFRGADAVLAEHGMNAVMYAIASETSEGSEYYLSADELSAMVASGRWEVQPHAGEGHTEVAIDDEGNTGPSYAYRAYDESEGLESFAEFGERVIADIEAGSDALAEEVEGYGDQTFSFPFGAFGQYGTNDERIPGFLREELGSRFEALFYQPSDAGFTYPGSSDRVQPRFEVRRGTSAAELGEWLSTNAAKSPATRDPG
jgi:peptidoglycan/xylan/chitin deacetylase (PgdA/CDA1 family)